VKLRKICLYHAEQVVILVFIKFLTLCRACDYTLLNKSILLVIARLCASNKHVGNHLCLDLSNVVFSKCRFLLRRRNKFSGLLCGCSLNGDK